MGTNKIQDNYLDYIPKRIHDISWVSKNNGLIQITIYRDSLFDKIVRKLFFTPDKYKIDLDKKGSFIWKHIDGKRSLYDISQLLRSEFGEEAEPLYKRLIEYTHILKNNKFIEIQ